MPVTLNPQNVGQSKSPGIFTTSTNRIYRNKRVRDDLNHYYTEADTQARAKFIGLPYIDLYGFPIDTAHLILLTKEEAQNAKIGVFTIKNKEVYLATSHPNYGGQAKIFTKLANNGYTYKLFFCSEISLDKLYRTYRFVVAMKEIDDSINIGQDKMLNVSKQGLSLSELSSVITSVSVSESIEIILISALQNNASDIHFEPEKDIYNLRFRLDGVLHTFAHLPKSIQKTIESRIKILSGLKLNIDNAPQDGRFSFKAGGKDIDVRVSLLPSNYGYSIVMRLLGTGSVALELTQLGFSGLAKSRVEKAIAKPQGLMLTTGPTGSGKTTTLYTFLAELNDGEGKIITLEDPVEYKLTGISQTQIDATAGYTFASGLRSILRQDPDVVMVGEIRDKETADIAVQASLTGHQVLSTIHTNDAAGSIPRMMEMGVKGYLLADSLSLVIGQRLVRRICKYCKQIDKLGEDDKKSVVEQLQKIPKISGVKLPHTLTFHTSTGCKKCNGLGYRGRIGLYEVMVVTDGLRNLLSKESLSIVEVRSVAQSEGMITMLQDGILKALEGKTDIKEVFRNVA